MRIGICGADCGGCVKYGSECSGCREMKGKVFWTAYTDGKCHIHDCCVGKGYDHCGKCDAMPCGLFTEITDPRLSDEENKAVMDRCAETLRSLK